MVAGAQVDPTNQDIRDPHAVQADPASTALVRDGFYYVRKKNRSMVTMRRELKKAVTFLLKAVENTPAQSANITTLLNTQPQTKLGKNIDVILTAQFFKQCASLHR